MRLTNTCKYLMTFVAGAVCVMSVRAEPEAKKDSLAEVYQPRVDQLQFSRHIENPHWPMPVGVTQIYEGRFGDDIERTEITYLEETRMVMGIECQQMHDVVYVNGEKEEETWDWFAQDNLGNVWYFGEETYEIEDGERVNSAGAWEAGVDEANPGIVMPAVPLPGQAYRQEFYPGHAEDMAAVVLTDTTITTKLRTYEHCWMVEEWTPLEPGVREHKFYAPGVGEIVEQSPSGSWRSELIETRKP